MATDANMPQTHVTVKNLNIQSCKKKKKIEFYQKSSAYCISTPSCLSLPVFNCS